MKKTIRTKKLTNYCLPAITIILILFTAFTLIKDADVAVGATTTTTVHRTTTTTTTCSCKVCNPTNGVCESRTTTHCPCTNSCTISSDCKTTATTTTIKCTCKACSASNWCSDRQYTGTGCPCRDTCSDHCECGATLERCKTATGATNCICSVRYSNTPCADTCRIDADCSTSDYSPPPTSHYVPPTSPPPTSPSPTSPSPTSPSTCKIFKFSLNGKTNVDQDPLIVWVKAPLTGYFSVNDTCKTCTVSSNDTWGYPPQTYEITTLDSDYTETFKINTSGTYAYILECIGTDPEDIDTNTFSLQVVKAENLPWWREIIPYLGGFLRGL